MALVQRSTLVDYVIPARGTRNTTLVRDVALIIIGSLLMALSARAQIILPFTPVPVTLQTFVLLLLASSLGSRRAALAMLLYLAEGASGLPVFAKGGGLAYFMSPTAGYLISYPFAAFAIGWFAEQRLDRDYRTSLTAMYPGSLIVFTLGVAWLGFSLHLNVSDAMVQGLYPFILGDVIKQLVAAAILPSVWLFVGKFRGEPLVDRNLPEKSSEE